MPLRFAVVLVVAHLLHAHIAAADPDEDKSPDVGLALSAGGAAASIGLVAYGLTAPRGGDLAATAVGLASGLITPSFGEWYAGKRWTAGLGLRFAGMAVAVFGASQVTICIDRCSSKPDNSFGTVAIGIGLVTYTAGIVWDVATAPSTVREQNALRHRPVITPSILKTPSGAPAYGIGVGGNF
jgi:hypothetical protein